MCLNNPHVRPTPRHVFEFEVRHKKMGKYIILTLYEISWENALLMYDFSTRFFNLPYVFAFLLHYLKISEGKQVKYLKEEEK